MRKVKPTRYIVVSLLNPFDDECGMKVVPIYHRRPIVSGSFFWTRQDQIYGEVVSVHARKSRAELMMAKWIALGRVKP